MSRVLASHGVERARGRCGGRPVIEGTRLTTETVLTVFVSGWSVATIVEQFAVSAEKVETALRFELCLAAKTPWAVELASAWRRKPARRSP